MSEQPAPLPDELTTLALGELEVRGRIMPASNVTLLGAVRLDGSVVDVVYKPVSGERPLWDFPDGTLAGREVAAHAVSEALGWSVVPPTLLRDGPLGLGMVQAWREPDPDASAVDLVPEGRTPDGCARVLDAWDSHDRAVSLVHETSVPLRRMAVFDAVTNNADRKGGHVLAMSDGHRYGVDHGLCFHVEHKLRTVLWGWAGEDLAGDDADAVSDLLAELETAGGDLVERLETLLTGREVEALRRRCGRLLRTGTMPRPSRSGPSIPWPAF